MDGKLGSKGRLAAVLESMPTVNDGDWKEEIVSSPSEPFISLIMCSRNPGVGSRCYDAEIKAGLCAYDWYELNG